MEDVVLRLHGDVAFMSAVRRAAVRREPVGCGVVVEQRIAPSAAVREPPAVLLRSRIVESGVTQDVFARPQHGDTAGLIKAAKAARNSRRSGASRSA
jgi:hypothetical protein